MDLVLSMSFMGFSFAGAPRPHRGSGSPMGFERWQVQPCPRSALQRATEEGLRQPFLEGKRPAKRPVAIGDTGIDLAFQVRRVVGGDEDVFLHVQLSVRLVKLGQRGPCGAGE